MAKIHDGAEFELLGVDEGRYIYASPHNIWDEIRVIFPVGYFDNMEVPKTVLIDIDLTPAEQRDAHTD